MTLATLEPEIYREGGGGVILRSKNEILKITWQQKYNRISYKAKAFVYMRHLIEPLHLPQV